MTPQTRQPVSNATLVRAVAAMIVWLALVIGPLAVIVHYQLQSPLIP